MDVPELPGSFYGFDHVELAIDHGSTADRSSPPVGAWTSGGRYEDLLVADCRTSTRRPIDAFNDWWQIYQAPYDPGAALDELHRRTHDLNFIEDAAAADGQPWLAWASFPDPHHPMCPPGEWFDRHDPSDMELPSTVDDPLSDAPKYLQRLSQLHPSTQRFWVQPCGVAGDHDLVRSAIAATYGMIEMIDDRIGRILAAIERAGQLDDTIIVFTADHGDMMGDHGLMLKGRMHYKGTLQVPMVIVDPRRTPGRTASLAGSLDLASTLLDLAGISGYDGIQGTSLVPILDDPAATVRSELLIEDDYPKALAVHRRTIAKTRTLVTDRHKYTRHDSGEDQLYDLEADPDEVAHLGSVEPRVRAEMIERMTDAVIDAADDAKGTPLAAVGR